MKVYVGSKNPVKIEAVKEAFSKYFNVEVEGHPAESGVPDQPMEDETYQGAENRAKELRKMDIAGEAEYYVGIEGGISKIHDKWMSYGVICIMNKQGKKGFGTSAHFELPQIVMEKIQAGEELGHVMDEIMEEENVKQKGGAIGFLTQNRMTRKELYVPGLITAMIPFLQKELF